MTKPHSYQRRLISCDCAETLIAVARDHAQQVGVNVSIAVLDASGAIKAFMQMDGAPVVSQNLALSKARSALIGLATQDLADAVAENTPMELSLATAEGSTLMGGGIPLFDQGELIGAVAVGGGMVDQDIACAQAAVDAVFKPVS